MNRYSFLEGNLHVLRRQNPAVYDWLTVSGGPIGPFEKKIITNEAGMLDWQLPTGRGLFENFPPDAAYHDWLWENGSELTTTLVIGTNLGYGINRILGKMGPDQKVWVLEPRRDLLAACLSQTDYRSLIAAKRLVFLPPDLEYFKRSVWQLDVDYVFGKVSVLADIPSHQIGPEYAMWTEQCKIILDRFSADLNTMRMNQDTMVKNELQNFARSIDDGDISPLRQKGRHLHAVVYGAGPSLTTFGPLLADHSDNAIHACGLQVMPSLFSMDLKPHFCMAIDYTDAMKGVCENLDREWAKDIPLIYSRKVCPDAVRTYPGPTLPIWTVGGLGTFMPREKEVVLNGGGSVGVALTRFLRWCGISRIVLVGFDFSWIGKKTHAAGHLTESGDFSFHSDGYVALENKWGDTIYSTGAYLTALRDLESDLKSENFSVFNLYGGGATIAGAPEVTWKELLDKKILSSSTHQLEGFLATLAEAQSPRSWPRFEPRSGQWDTSIQAVLKKIEKLCEAKIINQEEVRALFHQIVLFLKQDPLYHPYLFNEILEATRLSRSNKLLGTEDLAESASLLKRALKKVVEIDNCLIYRRKKAA